MKNLTIVLALLMGACGGGASSPAAPTSTAPAGPGPSSHYLVGYYHVVNPWTGDHMAELPPGTALAHVAPYGDEMLDLLPTLGGQGVRLVVQVHQWAFNEKPHPFNPRDIEGLLYRDWEQRFERVAAALEPIRGDVHSIYIADEPSGHGIPYDHLTTAIEWWQRRGYKTMVVGRIGGERPFNVDYYGITAYRMINGKWEVDWEEYEAEHRAVGANVVVGLGFNSPHNAPTVEGIEASKGLAARVNAEVLLWFLWPSIDSARVVGLAGSGLEMLTVEGS